MSKFNAQKIIDEHGGKCLTRDGRDALVLHIVEKENNQMFPILGAVREEGVWVPQSWEIDGTPSLNEHISSSAILDLIMPRTEVADWFTYVRGGKVGSISHAPLGFPLGGTPDYEVRTTLYSDDTVESKVVK